MSEKKFFVYLLISTSKTTYVGATVDLVRRLRQHNGELVGGAKATKIKVSKGEVWSRACYISDFPTWQSALQFEWKWKRLGRKFPRKMRPLERRINALKLLLSLDRSTTKAMPFSEWPNPPKINIELDDVNKYLNNTEN
jgi:structure-specific endonuclease subunit SLX1